MQVRSFSGELALLLVELKYFFQSRIERFPILFVADGKQMMQIKSLRESALEEKKNLIERIGVLDETLAKANKNPRHLLPRELSDILALLDVLPHVLE